MEQKACVLFCTDLLGTECLFPRQESVAEGPTGNIVPSAEYHLRQAELAARLALAETKPDKASALHVLALEHYDKATRAGLSAEIVSRIPALKDRTD
ncbi:hypothetical protein ACVILK_006837 [Bradyrhizobium embrapense]